MNNNIKSLIDKKTLTSKKAVEMVIEKDKETSIPWLESKIEK